MTIIRLPKSWEIPEREVTPEEAFLNRRRFLKSLIGAGVGATVLPILGCEQDKEVNSKLAATLDTTSLGKVERNPAFSTIDRPTTELTLAGQYNNYYEFGSTKSIWQAAQALPKNLSSRGAHLSVSLRGSLVDGHSLDWISDEVPYCSG